MTAKIGNFDLLDNRDLKCSVQIVIGMPRNFMVFSFRMLLGLAPYPITIPKLPVMLKQVWDFFKKPIYQEDTNTHFKYRLTIFLRLLLYALVISFGLGLVLGSLETVFKLNLGKHAIEAFLENHSVLYLLGAAVILAPLLEESIFRWPLYLFSDSRFFSYAFYLLTLIFGFYHITNYELNGTILALSPILVAPQLSLGVFLSFIRVRFGLVWAIAFHAVYNLIFTVPVLIMPIFDISLE